MHCCRGQGRAIHLHLLENCSKDAQLLNLSFTLGWDLAEHQLQTNISHKQTLFEQAEDIKSYLSLKPFIWDCKLSDKAILPEFSVGLVSVMQQRRRITGKPFKATSTLLYLVGWFLCMSLLFLSLCTHHYGSLQISEVIEASHSRPWHDAYYNQTHEDVHYVNIA